MLKLMHGGAFVADSLHTRQPNKRLKSLKRNDDVAATTVVKSLRAVVNFLTFVLRADRIDRSSVLKRHQQRRVGK